MKVFINGEETKRFLATQKWIILFERPSKGSKIIIEYLGVTALSFGVPHTALSQETFTADGVNKGYVLGRHADYEEKQQIRKKEIQELTQEVAEFNRYLSEKYNV